MNLLSFNKPAVTFDLETTSAEPDECRIVEMTFVRHERGEEVDRIETLVNPGIPIPKESSEIHGIYDNDVLESLSFGEWIDEILHIMSGAIVIGYNILNFDLRVLKAEFRRHGDVPDPFNFDDPDFFVVDVFQMYQKLRPGTLEAAHSEYVTKGETAEEQTHRAGDDVRMTIEVLDAFSMTELFLHSTPAELDKISRGDRIDLEGHFRTNENGDIVLGFGKYRGRSLADVYADLDGRSYLDWASRKVPDFSANLAAAAYLLKRKSEG